MFRSTKYKEYKINKSATILRKKRTSKDGRIWGESNVATRFCKDKNMITAYFKIGDKLSNLPVHTILWEAFNGEIPKDKKLSYVDGNRRNCILDNLELIDKKMKYTLSFVRGKYHSFIGKKYIGVFDTKAEGAIACEDILKNGNMTKYKKYNKGNVAKSCNIFMVQFKIIGKMYSSTPFKSRDEAEDLRDSIIDASDLSLINQDRCVEYDFSELKLIDIEVLKKSKWFKLIKNLI